MNASSSRSQDLQAKTLEICIDDLAGLNAAIAGGADRIELCAALELGGLTPSASMIAAAAHAPVPVHAMVRPRSGDFSYDEAEIDLVVEDIRRLRDLGVSGVVVGAANPDGELNEHALARFREAADGLSIVLHRVVDLAPDPVAGARIAAKQGYDFILTSGGSRSAFEGRATIARMVAETSGSLTIIAGGGLTPANVALVVNDARVMQIHASASGKLDWRDPRTEEFGFANGPRRVTAEARVGALKKALSELQ